MRVRGWVDEWIDGLVGSGVLACGARPKHTSKRRMTEMWVCHETRKRVPFPVYMILMGHNYTFNQQNGNRIELIAHANLV